LLQVAEGAVLEENQEHFHDFNEETLVRNLLSELELSVKMHPHALLLLLAYDFREDRLEELLDQLRRHQFEKLLLAVAVREEDGQECKLQEQVLCLLAAM
jgi:hypothetical protein